MVEVDIHCNVIRCRKPLSAERQACVTSCSHIFCVQCSNKLFSKSLTCPACNTSLSESEDIILIHLNPTEEYKSSVLAGLKPEIILDICTRAIAFYEYQTSQEISFRAMIQKNIQEKYKILRNQFEIATRDLNQVIKAEKGKMTTMLKDFELEKQKCQQVTVKFDEKNKQFQKLQSMYEKLKRKTINPNLQETFTTPTPPVVIAPPHLFQPTPFHSNKSNIINPMNDDLVSRMGKASNITGARSVFVPPRPPPSSHNPIQLKRYGHLRPSRIPSPSIASGNPLYPFRHPRRDSHDLHSQLPPNTTITAEETEFHHLRQHNQQGQVFRHRSLQIEPTTASYYNKFVEHARHNRLN